MSATPNINGEKIKGSITGITLFSATTISGGTFYGDGSNLTGISELYVTGGTFSNGNLTLVNNSGGTFVVSGSAPYNSGLITNATGWTDNGNGTLDLPQVQVALYDNSNFIEPLRVYTIPSGTTGSGGIPNLFDEDTSYIVIEYNGGNPRYYVYNNDGIINDSDIVLYMITYRSGNFVHVLEFDNYGAGLPNKINDRILSTDRFARESGFSLGLSGSTGVVTLTSGVAWNGVYRQQLPSLNSQDDIFFQSFHSGGTWVYTTTGNTLNNEYYDDGTDKVLATAGKYLVNWYFRGQEVNDHLYEVWGNDEYDSVADAQLSVEPLLPELITSHAFLTGRIIVQVSATTGYVESAFVRVFQSTQVTNHNDLLGLQGGGPGEYYHITSSEYNNLTYTNVDNNFSVGQTFNNGLTADTISATTYQNLPIDPDTYITGFSYNNNEFVISDNSGNTFNAVINDVTGLTVNGDLNVTGTTYSDSISASTYQNLPINYGSFGITIDGGGSDITTGNKGYAIIPYNGTITGWSIIGNTSGSCVIDVWKTTSGNIPTVLDTITGTEKPTLSSQQINSDLNLTTWTTSVSQYDVIGFNVDSTAGLTRVNLSIYIIKQ